MFKSSIPISPVYYELTTADDANSFSERNWKSWKIYGGNFDSDEHAKKDAQEWVAEDRREDYARKKKKKDIYDAMQSLEYEINTLFTSNGQTPFTSLAT